MIEELLHPSVQRFIQEHADSDETQLLLKYKEIEGVPMTTIADQLIGRRKARAKIPTYANTPGIIFPPGLSIEQCSSEVTAVYKAELLKNACIQRHTCADLTGGFGIDTFFLCKEFDTVHYIEPNESLLAIARHNHQLLGANNIIYHATNAESFISNTTLTFDAIFIDPSRRKNNANNKVSALKECSPDVTTLMKPILKQSPLLLLKAAPLLDIHQGLVELSYVERITIVSVENECKEILFTCARAKAEEPNIHAINLEKNHSRKFSFRLSEEKSETVVYGEPLTYLYEPNASILKAGAFKTVAHAFGLTKIHPNTHLYTSDQLRIDFPGRIFKIETFVKPNRKLLENLLPEMKANITTRNYPRSVAELKKQTSIQDGGEKFLIGFTGMKEKYLALASRV